MLEAMENLSRHGYMLLTYFFSSQILVYVVPNNEYAHLFTLLFRDGEVDSIIRAMHQLLETLNRKAFLKPFKRLSEL